MKKAFLILSSVLVSLVSLEAFAREGHEFILLQNQRDRKAQIQESLERESARDLQDAAEKTLKAGVQDQQTLGQHKQ